MLLRYTADGVGFLNYDNSDGVFALQDDTPQVWLDDNIMTNGDFCGSESPWVLGTGASHNRNRVSISTQTGGVNLLSQVAALVTNETYSITYTISNYRLGSVRMFSVGSEEDTGLDRSGSGTVTESFVAGSSVLQFISGIGGFVGDISFVLVHQCESLIPDLLLVNDSFSAGIFPWSVSGLGTATVAESDLVINSTIGTTSVSQSFPATVGEIYNVSVVGFTNPSSVATFSVDSDPNNIVSLSMNAERHSLVFVAHADFVTITLNGDVGISTWLQARITRGDPERSEQMHGVSAEVGSINKCPVALGSTVAAYSGFGPARIAVTSSPGSFDYGANDLAISAWANLSQLSPTDPDINLLAYGTFGITGASLIYSPSSQRFTMSAGSSAITFIDTIFPPGWQNYRAQRVGDTLNLYVDGELISSALVGAPSGASSEDRVLIGDIESSSPLKLYISSVTLENGSLNQGQIRQKYKSEVDMFNPLSDFVVDGNEYELTVGISSANVNHQTFRTSNTSYDRVNTESVLMGQEKQWSITTTPMHRFAYGVNDNIRIQSWDNFILSTNLHQTFAVDINQVGDLVDVQRIGDQSAQNKAGQLWVTSSMTIKEIP